MDIILFGITGFGNAVLEELIENNLKPKKIVTRKEKGPDPYLNSKNIIEIANKYKIPVEINKSYVLEKFDLCIVATYHRLIDLKKSNFSLAFNLHPSLLPKFKGKDPILKAIEKRAKYTGVTIHKLTEKFDEGEILYQKKIKIKKLEKKEIIKSMIPVYKFLTKKIVTEFI